MVEHDFIEGHVDAESDDTLSAAVAALAERADALPGDTVADSGTAPDDAPLASAHAVAEPGALTADANAATATTEATEDTSTATEAVADVAPGDADGLLDELSRAMRAAAGSRHLRIAEELALQRAAQVDAIKARATGESDDIKKASKRDIADVDAWMKTASELIAAERVRRIEARKERLRAELARQDVIVEREVVSIEAAVEAHQSRLDAFFEQLEHESDPAEIARLATSLPSLPSLAEVAEDARRRAEVEYARLEEPTADKAQIPDPNAIDAAAESEIEVSSSRLMAAMGGSSANGTDASRPWEPEPDAAVPAAEATTHASTEYQSPYGEPAASAQSDWAQPETTQGVEFEASVATDSTDTQAETSIPAEAQAPESADATVSDAGESHERSSVADDSGPLLRTIPSSRPIDRLRPPWNRKPDDEAAPTQES